MWKCEICKTQFDDEITAIEIRFGYVDSGRKEVKGNQYDSFYTECAYAPLCDECAIKYIKGEV